MVKANLSQQYREMHLASSSPQETVLMLYDGALRFLKDAAREIGENNIGAKAHLLLKAEKIIDYLQSCLDMEKGEEIAENLNKLYDYMLLRLTEANLHNDVPKLEEIITLLTTLREGWVSICDVARKGESAEASGPEKDRTAPKNITVHV
jgi:flagellar protein FliS